MKTNFSRLVRFVDVDGQIQYGEAGSILDPSKLIGTSVKTYRCSSPWDPNLEETGEQKEVKEVLSPLETVPVFYCVGLNYRKHIEETGMKAPEAPATFFKGPEALGGPLDEIEVHPECPRMDYEGELCAIIGKSCKDIKADEDVRSYILGYTVGNDVSCRYWQVTAGAAYAKSFDKFSPIGPAIASNEVVGKSLDLQLTTKVNDEIRQDARTDDLLFDVDTVVRFLSRGRTLSPGTVIMTGTPSGVAFGMKPPVWLKDGDVVEIEIEKVGIIRNKFAIPTTREVRL